MHLEKTRLFLEREERRKNVQICTSQENNILEDEQLTKIVRQKRMENTYTLTAHFLGREELEDWSHPFVLSLQHLDCQHYDGRFPGPQADA